MLQLRDYQQGAVDAVFDYWGDEPGNPLVDLATGTGKSLVMSELIKRLVDGWPDFRIVVATHVAELIEQNYLELLGAWEFAPAGIYSAGLKRRDRSAQILFAGIQTVWNKDIGHRDVLLVDEAHLIPANAETMYGKFITNLKQVNPDMKIVGLTATPFRLDSGRLDEGENCLFDKVVYEYGIGAGIQDGYLAPLSSKAMTTEFDITGVGRLGGDYKQSALQRAVDKTDVTVAAVDEIIAKAGNRRSWLVFGSGVEHAENIRDEIRGRGITCETITGGTPKDERRRILEAYKRYEIKCLTNNSVLTTGFNHKGVDLIAFMRPTLSASLYLQMAGRGTRPLYATGADLSTVEARIDAIENGPKPNCLVLDFAGLVARHGPVDDVKPKKPGEGGGEAPAKECPECAELIQISLMTCPCCGYKFPPSEDPKHDATASDAPILSTQEPYWRTVTSRTFRRHEKAGGKPSVRCDYMMGMEVQKEWLCVEHTGFAKVKADKFWKRHGGKAPFPSSVEEFLDRVEEGEILETEWIQLRKNGRFYDVLDHKAGEAMPNETAANDNEKERLKQVVGKDFDDEIPF